MFIISFDSQSITENKCGKTISGQSNENADTPIQLKCDAGGRFIDVSRNTSEVITLCEVELYGEVIQG